MRISFQNLDAKIREMQCGFVIVGNNRQASVSNLKGRPEHKMLPTKTKEEFSDYLLDVQEVTFRHYDLNDKYDLFVIGNHNHTNEEAMSLLHLFRFANLKPDYRMISAVTGVRFTKTIAKELENAFTHNSSSDQTPDLENSINKQNIGLDLFSRNNIRKFKTIKPWSTIAASIILAIVFGTMTTITTDMQQVEAILLQEAQEYLGKGDYVNAIETFEQILQIDPNNAQAIHGKELALEAQIRDPLNVKMQDLQKLLTNGENFSIKRQFGNAIIHYQEVVNRYPNHVKGLTGLGYAQYNVGEFDSSLKNFKHATSIKPNNINSLNGLGLTHTKMGNYYDALHYLKKSIELDQNNTNTLNAFGIFHVRFFEYEPAKESFSYSLELDPEKLETLNGLATVHYREQNYEMAINLFNHIVEKDENHRDALFGLGISYIANGNSSEGQKFLDHVESIDENTVESVIIEANSLMNSGQSNTAILLLDNLLARNPDNIEVLTAYGNALLLKEDSFSALSIFNKVLNIDPVYTNAIIGKINALIDLSRFEEAQNILSLLTQIDPENKHIKSLTENLSEEIDQ